MTTDPDEFDVEEVLRRGSERELTWVWDVYHQRQLWQRVIAENAGADGNPDRLARAHRSLTELPDVTATQALEANAMLVDLLVGRRWYVMRDAREAQASWTEIGDALGISRQGAYDFHRRAVEDQEKYAAGLHDSQRARAAMDDQGTVPGPRPPSQLSNSRPRSPAQP